jgi:hypothetical protein
MGRLGLLRGPGLPTGGCRLGIGSRGAMETPVKARLDKSGWRVLCGWGRCGTEICKAMWMDKSKSTRGGQVVLRAKFLPGWHEVNGAMVPTKRSQKRIRAMLDRQEDRVFEKAFAPSEGTWKEDGRWVYAMQTPEIDPPLWAHCPNPGCGRLNLIEPRERPSPRRAPREWGLDSA